MSKLQNMCVLRILSIFLAVGIAAGAFFSGKKAVPGFWGHATLEKTQFFSCFVYLGPFGSPLESLWLPLGWPWLPLGCHWAPFGVPLARFGCPWLALGALGSLWVPLGSFWELNVHRLRCLCTKSSLLELVTDVTDVTDVTEVVSSTAAQTPTSTRAGG